MRDPPRDKLRASIEIVLHEEESITDALARIRALPGMQEISIKVMKWDSKKRRLMIGSGVNALVVSVNPKTSKNKRVA